MSDELDRIMERTRQNRTRGATAPSTTASDRPVAAGAQNGTFRAGDRVFDLVSGREGVVTTMAGPAKPDEPLVFVRLEAGGMVLRELTKLVPRPSPPSGASR